MFYECLQTVVYSQEGNTCSCTKVKINRVRICINRAGLQTRGCARVRGRLRVPLSYGNRSTPYLSHIHMQHSEFTYITSN